MSAGRVINALLSVARAAHAAFTNSEPAGDASHARIINDHDYAELTRALFILNQILPKEGSVSAPLRAERALHPLLEFLEEVERAGAAVGPNYVFMAGSNETVPVQHAGRPWVRFPKGVERRMGSDRREAGILQASAPTLEGVDHGG